MLFYTMWSHKFWIFPFEILLCEVEIGNVTKVDPSVIDGLVELITKFVVKFPEKEKYFALLQYLRNFSFTVVYFDQCLCGANSKQWSKYFLFLFFHLKIFKMEQKVEKWGQECVFGLHPIAGVRFYSQKKIS